MQGVARLCLIEKRWSLELDFPLEKGTGACWSLDVHRAYTGDVDRALKSFSIEGSRTFAALTQGVRAHTCAPHAAIAKSTFYFERGLETANSFEFFLSKNDELVGQLTIERSTPVGVDQPWLATFVDSKFIPNAVLKGAPMPLDGSSALPSALEKVIPHEFRYWLHKGEDAGIVRKALVEGITLREIALANVDGDLAVVKRSFSIVSDTPTAVAVAADWPLFKSASLLPSGTSVTEVFAPSLEEIRKATDDGKHVAYIDAGEAIDGTIATLATSLEKHAGDFVITAFDSPAARAQLGSLGRVFKFVPGGEIGIDAVNRVFVASFGVRSDDVRWIDKADGDEEEYRRLRVYNEPSADHTDLGKAAWTSAYVNDLPDANFLYVEPGGEKDEEGKTKPRSLRHFPFKGKDGSIDLAHVRNAIGRIPQSNASGLDAGKKESLQTKARALLEHAQKAAEFNNPDPGGPGDLKQPPAALEKKIEHRSDGYHVMSEDGSKHLGGPYDTKGEAIDRLRQVEGHKEKSDLESGGPGTLQPVTTPWDVAGKPRVRELKFEIVKAQERDNDEHYVLGIVLEPNTVDKQNDIYSADEVRAASYKYMAEFQNRGLMHKTIVNGKVDILESYIAPIDFTIGSQHVQKGTWLMAVRVKDAGLWKEVKTGGLTGFSIGGSANRQPDPAADKKYKTREAKANRKIAFQGIPVTVDRPKGTIQEGVNKEGEPWSREYKTDYGFIPRTKGGDGEGLDVFLGPNGNSPLAYWVTQRKDDGSFDEYKLILGCDSVEEAKKIYLDHVPAKYFGGIAEGDVHQIKALLNQHPEPALSAA